MITFDEKDNKEWKDKMNKFSEDYAKRDSRMLHGLGVFFTGVICITASASKVPGSRGMAISSGLFCAALYYFMP